MNKLMTITETAKKIGVTSRTIMRWETQKKVRKAKRDWRGWRVYDEKDIKELMRFRNSFHIVD